MFFDTLRNFVSSLGVPGKDKGASGQFVHEEIDRSTIDAIYRDDAFGRKVVDIPAFDMIREWRGWQAEKDKITFLEGEERRLGVQGKVHEALTLSRLYGGAVIVMHDGAADLTTPLRVTGKGGLKTIMVLHRYRIRPGDIEWDPTKEGFDQPQWWEFTAGAAAGIRIHPSRVVKFSGNPVPSAGESGSTEQRTWGDSVYQSIRDNVRQAASTNAAVAALVEEAKTDVVKVPGFLAQIGTAEYRKRLQERVELAAIMKSITNTTIIDGDEEWERKQIAFAHMPELQQQAMQLLSGAADIPAPRFLSQSPGGLNSTGDADLRNYYDGLSARQNVHLGPLLTPLDDALIMSALGSLPPKVRCEWRPLWQLSATEQAEVELARATAAKTLAESRMVPMAALAKGVQNKLIEDGTYPGLEEAIAEAEAGTLLPFEEPTGPDGLPLGGPRPAAAPGAGAGLAGKPGATPKAANQNHEITVNGPGGLSIKAKVRNRDGLMRDATPRTLYVSRRLLNAQQFQRWAVAQGFTSTVPQAEMHVTIAYSRDPIDWMKVGQDWYGSDETGKLRISAGGPRSVERFGSAVVLEFTADPLRYRHERVMEAGGSHDFPDYRPHVTIAYDVPPGFDLSKVEPFRGSLLFGPEIFQEVSEELP